MISQKARLFAHIVISICDDLGQFPIVSIPTIAAFIAHNYARSRTSDVRGTAPWAKTKPNLIVTARGSVPGRPQREDRYAR